MAGQKAQKSPKIPFIGLILPPSFLPPINSLAMKSPFTDLTLNG